MLAEDWFWSVGMEYLTRYSLEAHSQEFGLSTVCSFDDIENHKN